MAQFTKLDVAPCTLRAPCALGQQQYGRGVSVLLSLQEGGDIVGMVIPFRGRRLP